METTQDLIEEYDNLMQAGLDEVAVNEMENGNGYYVRHKYRAKNSCGGYVIENKVFFLDSNGNVTYTVDY